MLRTKLFRLAPLRGVTSAPRLGFLACPGCPGCPGAGSPCSSSCGASLTLGVDPMSCFMRASICAAMQVEAADFGSYNAILGL